MSPPPRRRRPPVPPLSELDAPGRSRDAEADATLWTRPAPAPADAPGAGGTPPNAGPAAAGTRGVGGAHRAPVEEADPVAQRLVAEERAAAARSALAERAAAVVAGTGSTRPLGAWIALGAAAGLIAVRLWLVGTGALFGRVPVHALDVAAVLALALGLALRPGPRLTSALAPAPGRGRRLAVALAVPGLAGAGLTLVQPATPAAAPAPACPAAPVRGAAVTAVTGTGVTARSGPGRAYPTTGRFPAGCAVGVAGFCLGDPLPVPGGWVDSRWLLVSRHTGPGGVVARHLSGEPALPRFLPAAAVAAAGTGLRALPPADCGRDGPAAPGDAYVEELATGGTGDNLGARAARAANIGFAVWVRPDPATGGSQLLRGQPYQQIAGAAAGPGGRATTRWDFPTLVRDLDPRRRTQTVTLTVLAVGCAGPAAPAAARTASLTTYQVVDGQLGPLAQRLRGYEAATELPGLDLDRLTATACQPPT